jgi:dCMP deaminase
MIVGIAGLNGSGKSAAVAFLSEASFVPLSLSDVIRSELTRRGIEETRERMIEVGNELRRLEGADVLARRLASRISSDRNYVIDSIRNPAEVGALRELSKDFRLYWIDATDDVRLERIRARGRRGDPSSREDLAAVEKRERKSGDALAQQLDAVRDMADESIRNDGSIEDLHESIRGLLKRGMYFARPGWDEYFISIARVVASRSNCVKRKVAAVVTIDRRVVSTGYNGTPRGVRNCNEGGCARCNSFGPGGAALSECVCSHGEENAITQAAYHGVALRGATLYSTFCPCLLCTKMIINAGIAEVVYNGEYPLGEISLSLLREAGVKVRQVEIS